MVSVMLQSNPEKIAARLNRFIDISATICVLFFGWLALSQEKIIDAIVTQDDSTFLIQVGLFIYFSAFVYGARFDVYIQSVAYTQTEPPEKLGLRTYGYMLAFLLIGLVLLYLHSQGFYFSIGLLFLIASNFFGWRFINAKTEQYYLDTLEAMKKSDDYLGLEIAENAREYMAGDWQRTRFLWMAILSVVFFSVYTLLDLNLISLEIFNVQLLGVPISKVASFTPGFLFIVYVLVSEIWIYAKRPKYYFRILALFELREKYSVVPKQIVPRGIADEKSPASSSSK